MRVLFFIVIFFFFACAGPGTKDEPQPEWDTDNKKPSVVILGTTQDGGSPHAGCLKDCCKKLFSDHCKTRWVVSLGIIDPVNKMNWLVEATPDIASQLRSLKNYSPFKTDDRPDGIFLTHAHIGHYSGLMYLGKEAMGGSRIPVYAMPRMKSYLETNGPWSQLVSLQNIELRLLEESKVVRLSLSVRIRPFLVPHRDEYSETVGYTIEGPDKKMLFIPDIDKWEKWNKAIIAEIAKVDYALIDGTFFDGKEIKNRNISEIPHPFVIESMELFRSLPTAEKSKIHFIHLNHTNPLLRPGSEESEKVTKKGFHVAVEAQVFPL